MWAVNWRLFTISMLACGGIAFALHHWLRFPFGASLGIVIFAVLINAWIAAVEDHW